MDIGAISSGSPTVDANETGFNALKAEDFLKLLIVELQNQDPTEPTSNEQLLTQISTIQGLQSNLELSAAIKSTTSTQQLSTAANFIGQQVIAAADGVGEVSGLVERAFVSEGKVFVTIDGRDFPLDGIHTVNSTP